MNSRVATLENPSYGSITIDRGRAETADAMIARLAAEGEAQARDACLVRIIDLSQRYEVARSAILALQPSANVAEFGIVPPGNVSRTYAERVKGERLKLVERLEERVIELDSESVANIPLIDKLRLALDNALVRIARLERLAEGRAGVGPESSVTARRSRADVPQFLVPGGGAQPAGLWRGRGFVWHTYVAPQRRTTRRQLKGWG